MAESDCSPPKKARLSPILDKFNTLTELEKEVFDFSYTELMTDKRYCLLSDIITSCDASTDYGKPFSKATCRADPTTDVLHPFESIFGRGVNILNGLIRNDSDILQDDETRALLEPLVKFLFDKDSHDRLKSAYDNETELMVTLAVHFFSKLAVSKGFRMDKSVGRKESICKCGACNKSDILSCYGDTSIGNRKVWHGSVDILLESSEIGVHLTPEDDNKSPGGRTMIEVKFSEIETLSVRDQVLAQAITFSFIQRQRHPAMKHFLIPTILASNKSVQFFFYDSKNDILLESRELKFFLGSGVLNYRAVIAAWMVLNYKYLCSGPTTKMLNGSKANFHKFAGSALEIYSSQLKFQNVYDDVRKRPRVTEVWEEMDNGLLNRSDFELVNFKLK